MHFSWRLTYRGCDLYMSYVHIAYINIKSAATGPYDVDSFYKQCVLYMSCMLFLLLYILTIWALPRDPPVCDTQNMYLVDILGNSESSRLT